MTDNIPPEPKILNLADALRASVESAPAPVRISPEVRRVLLDALLSAEDDVWNDSSDAEIVMARAFVEALP